MPVTFGPLKSGKVRASGNVTDCTEMYYGCSSMTGADVSFDIGPETQFSMMFGNCDSLNGVEFAGVHKQNPFVCRRRKPTALGRWEEPCKFVAINLGSRCTFV